MFKGVIGGDSGLPRLAALACAAALAMPQLAVPAHAQSEFYIVRDRTAGACKLVDVPPNTTEVVLLAGGRVFASEAAAGEQMGALAECKTAGTKTAGTKTADANTGEAHPKAAHLARPHRVHAKKPAKPRPPADRPSSVAVSASRQQPFGFLFGGWR